MLDIAASLLSLTVLEIVLGVDNLVFISIMAGKVAKNKQVAVMRLGLSAAWITRLLLLLLATWMVKLSHPLFSVGTFDVSFRDLFLFFGGLFLLYKAITEIHEMFVAHKQEEVVARSANQWVVIGQIMVLDIVFSIDSILTAVGLTQVYWIMATAITIAIILMIFMSRPLHSFIEKNPSVKMLALAFLVLIGTVLVADGLHYHIDRKYIYAAICFSLFVEMLNVLRAKKQ